MFKSHAQGATLSDDRHTPLTMCDPPTAGSVVPGNIPTRPTHSHWSASTQALCSQSELLELRHRLVASSLCHMGIGDVVPHATPCDQVVQQDISTAVNPQPIRSAFRVLTQSDHGGQLLRSQQAPNQLCLVQELLQVNGKTATCRNGTNPKLCFERPSCPSEEKCL